MHRLFGGNPLLFAKEKQRKCSNPGKQIHTQHFCLFVVLSLPLFHTMNAPCNVRGKFLHFCPGLRGLGKEQEVKSFYRENSEIWSVSDPMDGSKTPVSRYPAHFIHMYELFRLLAPFLSTAQVLGDVNISSLLCKHHVSDSLSLVKSTCTPIVVTTLAI